MKRIAVIGAGAVGGITAAYISAKKFDVTLVCRSEELAARINENGLAIKRAGINEVYRLPAVGSIEELRGFFDVIFIATKLYDLSDAAQRALPFLREDSLVVALQNGMSFEILCPIVGASRAANAIVTFSASMAAPACLELTAKGGYVLGMSDAQNDERITSLAAIMERAFPTRVSSDMKAELFSKLIINSAVTSLGAMSGLTLGKLTRIKRVREIFIGVAREAVAVADKAGIKLPRFGGKLDYYRFVSGNGPLNSLRRHLFIRLFGLSYKNLKSSSLQSLERGGRTEIDYLNGYFMREGERLGVKTPINNAICEIVGEIERGERAMAPDNLFDARIALILALSK